MTTTSDNCTRFFFGIRGLDKLMPTGILPGSIVLVRGTPGTGKTLLAIQCLHFAYKSETGDLNNPTLSKGQRICICCEEAKASVESHISEFRWQEISNTQAKVVNLNVQPNIAEDKFEQAVEELLGQIKNELQERPEVLAIDGLTFLQRYITLHELHGREETFIRSFTHNLFKVLRECAPLPAFYVLTAEALSEIPRQSVSCEEYLADIVIDLSLQETVPGLRQRRVEIRKSRHARQILGEHSLWILGRKTLVNNPPDLVKLLASSPRAGKDHLAIPGIFVFPRKSLTPMAQERIQEPSKVIIQEPIQRKIRFGIPGLDSMLGPVDEVISFDKDKQMLQYGLDRHSSTVVIGPTGTGKTYLGLCFALETSRIPTTASEAERDNARVGSKALVISFDQLREEILRFNGTLVTDYESQARTGGGHQPDLGELSTLSDEENKRSVHIVYVNPVNFDIDLFLECLKMALDAARYERVFIDSINDVQKCLRHPERFPDFLVHLFSILRQTTSLVTYEIETVTGQFETPETGVSYIADNVIATRHIPINDRLRKALFIVKKRGSDFSNDVRELRVISRKAPKNGKEVERKWVEITRDLDLYADLLVGAPKPIEVFLKLFWENKPQKDFNNSIVTDLKERYLNLQVSSFTKAQMDLVLESGGEQAFESPHSNVKVVSVDEHWIRAFAGGVDDLGAINPRAELYDMSSEIPREDQGDFYYRLMQTARREEYQQILEETGERIQDIGKPLYAVPNYVDFGLFCCRKDLMRKFDVAPPISWDEDPNLPGQYLDLPSIWKRVREQRGEGDEHLCGFAFEMATPQTFVTTFIEFAWNFGANINFVGEQEANRRMYNMKCFTRALRYLHSLIHKYDGLLPFPCTMEHCAHSLFSRHWYSTIQSLIQDDLNHPEIDGNISLVPFPTSRSFREKENIQTLLDLAKNSHEKYCKIDEKYIDYSTISAVQPGDGKSRILLPDNKRHFVKEQIRRLKERIEELEAFLRDSTSRVSGNSCSGSWYLGILQSSKTHNLPASLIREMVSPGRSHERVKKGAGLPTRESFYKIYGDEPIPNLSPDWTFTRLYRELMGRIRSRRSVFLKKIGLQEGEKESRYDRVVGLLHRKLMEALGDKSFGPYGDSEEAKRMEAAMYTDPPKNDPMFEKIVEPLFWEITKES